MSCCMDPAEPRDGRRPNSWLWPPSSSSFRGPLGVGGEGTLLPHFPPLPPLILCMYIYTYTALKNNATFAGRIEPTKMLKIRPGTPPGVHPTQFFIRRNFRRNKKNLRAPGPENGPEAANGE